MSEKLTREQIELARAEIPLALGRESIGPINALCDLALSAADAEQRGRAEAVQAVRKIETDFGVIYPAEVIATIQALSTSPDHVLVPRDFIRGVAELHLHDSNGGKENFVRSGHDVAPLVHRARAMIAEVKS